MPRWCLLVCGVALAACSGEDPPAAADAARPADDVPAERAVFVNPAPDADAPDVAPPDAAPDDVAAPPPDAPTPPEGACVDRVGARGDTTFRMMSGGRDRTFVVHVPPSYDRTRPTPVVMDFHGWLGDGGAQATMTGLRTEADVRGLITVHPDGIGRSWNAGACCTPASTSGVDDVQFVRDLLDRVERDWCVDRRRVHAMGFSNGAGFSHRLACELSERVASIGPVSGTVAIPTCAPRRPVPVLHTHGTLDVVVPYLGGSFGGFEAVAATITRWATLDGCSDAPTESYRRGNVRCATQSRCREGAEVTLCTVTNGAHAWPANGDLRATAHILDFFARHPMP